MRYFTHGVNIAVAETEATAARYVAKGWQELSADAFDAAWQARDMAQLSEAWVGLVERAVGQPVVRTKIVDGVERPIWW